MYISKIRIENYKSFLNSGEIEFKSGINIIIGQNNSGKTALLEALSHKYEQILHLSEKTNQKSGMKIFYSDVFQSSCIEIHSDEIIRILQEPQFDYFTTIRSLENYNITRTGHKNIFDFGATIHLERKKPVLFNFGPYTEELPDNSSKKIVYVRDNDDKYFEIKDKDFREYFPNSSPQLTLGEKFAQYILDNIYMLKSERMNIDNCPFGLSRELKTDAKNLAEVLHSIKTNNSYLFQQYVDLVNEVIPSVKDISIATEIIGEIGALGYNIKIWTLSPHLQQESLVIPLSQSGTGVSQVLAILYVVLINKDRPKIIIIDEPNSFLHPEASKKLIQILNRFPQHQYFISTHSPEIITAAKPSTVTRLKHIDGETKVESIDLSNNSELKNTFKELGIKQGDFFFSENILWVEGETEEKAFPLILEKLGFENFTVLSVMPSEIRNRKKARKNTKNIFKIYNQLSGTDALIPSNIIFILDREDYSENALHDDKKEFGESLHFIPRRMFENYLLDAKAIVSVYNETAVEDAPEVTFKQVTKWIEDNRKDSKYSSKLVKNKEDDWQKDIDGAKLLYDLFTQLSETTNPFYKTTHSVMLTEWLLENKPEILDELKNFLINLISDEKSA